MPSDLPARSSVRALRRDDLGVAFQPIVSTATGKVFAYEALVRCTVPAYSIPPMLFEAAEREQCCGWLGRQIREVCFDLVAGTPIFVNLHPVELNERYLVQPDDPIGFHDHEVYLEVTESAALGHLELTKRVLRDLKTRIGAKTVVDDFGAGYSDVFRVLELEPDVVKIDRSLVTHADQSEEKRERLNYLVDLCTELGAVVVVEGVETPGELRAVRAAGAPYVQGYLIAKPAFPPPRINWDPAWLRGIAVSSRRPDP